MSGWWLFTFWAVVAYLAIGLCAAVVLKQTPYAENPLWTMILLWWLYFF